MSQTKRPSEELALPDLSKAANAKQHVFFPLKDTVAKVEELFGDASVAFIRAGVGAGKTTLAKYLAETNSKYTLVPICFDQANSKEGWTRKIVAAIGINHAIDTATTDPLEDALGRAAQQKKTLIFDEAHLLFSSAELVAILFKSGQPRPRFLLFSAASQGERDGEPIATPSEISQKWMWYPPMPVDHKQLSLELSKASVSLTPDATGFLLQMCAGHRSIFMAAMLWVRRMQQRRKKNRTPQKQKVATEEKKEWNLVQCVSEVRESIANGWSAGGFLAALAGSRAVKVNGQYTHLETTPLPFAEILVCGPTDSLDAKICKALTIAGFLLPKRGRTTAEDAEEEFVLLDWNLPSVCFGISNPWMAKYYDEMLRERRNLRSQLRQDMDMPSTVADTLARALPCMDFACVVAISTLNGRTQELVSSLSSTQLPYEDDYNDAIARVLTKLGFTVTKPQKPASGKVDNYVRFGLEMKETAAIEGIKTKRDQEAHNEHRSRFNDPKKNTYNGAKHKGLWTLGRSDTLVYTRVNDTEANGVEIIGLVVSPSHDSYSMYVKPAASKERGAEDPKDIKGPFFFPCDRVPRALQKNARGVLEVTSAQEFVSMEGSKSGNEEKSEAFEFESWCHSLKLSKQTQAFLVSESLDTAEALAGSFDDLPSQEELKCNRGERGRFVTAVKKLARDQ